MDDTEEKLSRKDLKKMSQELWSLSSFTNEPPRVDQFIPSKKDKKSQFRKKKTSDNKSLKHLPPMPTPLTMPIPAINISGSEAEFLSRQFHHSASGEVIANTVHQPHMEVAIPLPNIKSRSAESKDHENFRTESVRSQLQVQIDAQQHLIREKEKLIAKKDEKIKALSNEIERVKRDLAGDMAKMRHDHDLEILRINEQFLKQKAILLTTSDNSRPEGSDKGPNSEFQDLLNQLDQIRKELRKSQDQHEEERRSILSKHQLQLQEVERKHKGEILGVKTQNNALEERIQSLIESQRAYELQIKQLEHQNLSLQQQKQEALQSQLRLRNDLKNMQQSLQASYRFDSSAQKSPVKDATSSLSPAASESQRNPFPVSSLPNDIEAALKLHDAKYEAKLRQMQNKLEFLKSQLEAERKELDDTKLLLTTAMTDREKLIQQHDRRLQSLAREHEEKIAQHEEKVVAVYEKRMLELTNLQKQFSAMMSQSNELQQQNAVITQQMESHQSTISRLQTQLLNYQTEIEQYKQQVFLLEQEKAQDIVKENQKVSQETLIKRLDNERNYLKSQLKSEIVLKNELQTMFDEKVSLLQESQSQWQRDVESLQQRIQALNSSLQEKESEHQLAMTQLRQEKTSMQQQLQEVKQGFQQCRESLRMEQYTLEQMTASRDRSEKLLSEATEDSLRLKKELASTHDHYQQQIAAIQAFLKNSEEKSLREKKLLAEEMRGTLEQLSESNQQIVDLKEERARSDALAVKKIYLMRIVKARETSQKLRVLQCFHRWQLSNSLAKIANQFKQQMERILSKQREQQEKDQQQALQHQKHSLTLEKIEEINKLSERWKETSDEEKKAMEASFEERIETLTKQHSSAIEEMERDHRFDLERLQSVSNEKLKDLLDGFQREREDWEKESRRQLQAAKDQFYGVDLPEASAALRERLSHEHNEVLSKELSKWREERAVMERNHEVDLDHRLHELQRQHEDFLELQRSKFEEERALWRANQEFLVEKQRKEAGKSLEDSRRLWEEESERQRVAALQLCRQELHEQHETRLRELEDLWREKYDQMLEEEKEKLRLQLEEEIHRVSREKEVEKQQFAKQEAKKWKTILQEQSKSQELEVQKIILQTRNECDRQFSSERELLQKSLELEKLKERDLYQVKLQEQLLDSEKRHQEQLEAQQKRFEDEKKSFESQLRDTFQKEFDQLFAQALLQKTEEFDKLLSVEQKRQDSLKEDFSKQMKNFARERDTLIRQQQSLEKQLEGKEEEHLQALSSLREEFTREKDRLRQDFEEDKRLASFSAQQERINALADQKEDLNRQFAVRLREEKERMREENDSQFSAMKQENEKLIKQLETGLDELRQEKDLLVSDLAELSHRLQETEDALFDMTNERNQLQTSKSLLFWQCVTKLQLLKLRFQKGIQEFDAEAKKRFQNLQMQLSEKWNDLAVQFMRSNSLVFEFDQRRQSLLRQLNQSKQQEEMQCSKKNIQLLEFEIDKLHSEKLSLEENKGILAREIEGLTKEIQEQEDLIRQHHAQESAMTINGRVNIVFARKKRRLDQEIERLLELTETKRNQIQEIEEKIVNKVKIREEKELLLIQYEQQFIAIIIQQQKEIHKELIDWQSFADRSKALCQMIRFPFPPVPADPSTHELPEISLGDVEKLVQRWKQEDERKERMNTWKDQPENE